MIVDELSNDGDTNGPGMQEGHPMQAGAKSLVECQLQPKPILKRHTSYLDSHQQSLQ
jgi:hypothetical protein